MEGMCGYIQRGAFSDLRLGRRRENKLDFEVLGPMERLQDQMKRTAGFVVCNRGMVINRELTVQVLGKNSMDCPPMPVVFRPMAMVGLWMDMDQWRGEHPQGRPYKEQHPRKRWCVTYPLH